jgi:rubrerythrin
MRVRHKPQSESRRRAGKLARRSTEARREEVAPASEPQPAPDASHGGTAGARHDHDLFDERRMRASGGPHDRAQYTCVCGYVFEADVSTSVACPNCGASQAW